MGELVSDAGNKRPIVHGIDMLRIIAAVWVAFSHGAYPQVGSMIDPLSHKLGWVVGEILANTFNGSAAVAVFFIVSGFCIHYPNVNKISLDWRTFVIRRGVRIGFPMAAIFSIAFLLGSRFKEIELNLFWSLYCELIYYALYPLLFLFLKRVKLQHVLYSSAAISVIVLLLAPNTLIIWQFGVQWTWLFCYPAWLLGALLAQNFDLEKKPLLAGSLWIWRGLIVALSAAGLFLFYHMKPIIGFPWTIAPVVILAYFWIHDELLAYKPGFFRSRLEVLGQSSYTVYLVHMQVLTAVALYIGKWHPLLIWAAQTCGIVLSVAIFYFAVERPAHTLAKRIRIPGRKTTSKTNPSMPGA